MNQRIDLSLTKERFNYEYISLLNPILNLTTKEIEVIATIKNYYDEYQDWEEVSSPLIRKRIAREIGCTVASYNNYLSSLRKKKVIQQVGDSYRLIPLIANINSEIKSLTFNLSLN